MEMNVRKDADSKEMARLFKVGKSWLSNKSNRGSDLVKCSEIEKTAYLYAAYDLLEEQRKNDEIEDSGITAERMLFLADSPAACSYAADRLRSSFWLMKIPYLNSAGQFSLKKMPGEFHREALNFVYLERKFPRFLPALILIAAVLVGIAGTVLLTLPDVAAGLAGEDGMNVLYAVIMLVMAVSCLCFGIWWGGGITVAVGAGIVFLGSKIPLELLRRFSPSAALLIAVVILIMVHHYMRNQEKKLAHLCEYAERVLKYGETILANLLKGVPAITDLDTPFSNELLSGEEGVKYVRIESLRLYGEAIDREMRNIRNRLKKLGK